MRKLPAQGMPQFRLRRQPLHRVRQRRRHRRAGPAVRCARARIDLGDPASAEPITGQACAMASGITLGRPSASPSGATTLGTSSDQAPAMRRATASGGSQPVSSTAARVARNRLQHRPQRPVADADARGSRPLRHAAGERHRPEPRCPSSARSGQRTDGKAGRSAARGGLSGSSTPIGSTAILSRGTPCASAMSATAAETQMKRAAVATTAGHRRACSVPTPVLGLAHVAPMQRHDQALAERLRERQCKCAAARKLRVQHIGGGTDIQLRHAPGVAEQQSLQPTGRTRPPPNRSTLPPSAAASCMTCRPTQTGDSRVKPTYWRRRNWISDGHTDPVAIDQQRRHAGRRPCALVWCKEVALMSGRRSSGLVGRSASAVLRPGSCANSPLFLHDSTGRHCPIGA